MTVHGDLRRRHNWKEGSTLRMLSLARIAAGLAALKKQYPDSKAATEATEIAKKYGLM